MVSNKTDSSKLEQWSVIKFLLAKKYKQCKIYRRMCDVYREVCLSQEMFTKGVNMGLLLQAQVGKTIHGVETHHLYSKEKVPGEVVSKEGPTDNLWNIKGFITVYSHTFFKEKQFLWKRCSCKQCFLLPTS